MSNNICPRCGTENEPEYSFCKNCGTPLNTATNQNENNTYSNTTNTNYTNPPVTNEGFNFGGITAEEMTLFVGKKSNEIIPKFAKMEVTNSKISWCWPVAILSLFFGASGASLWFFYRKMYKPATLFAILGAVLTVITSIVTGVISPDLTEMLNEVLESGDINAIINSFSNVSPAQMLIYTTTTFFNDMIEIVIFILCGLFGYHIYKNHCIEKIHNFKIHQAESPYYKLGLSSIGGVSGGMMALGIIIMVVVANISSIITTIINFL